MTCEVETVYAEFDVPLRRFVRARVTDPAAADDIVQDVYLRIHRNIASLRDCRKLAAWLYQIARHAIIDYYRRGRPAGELPETLALPPDPCADDVACELAASLPSLIDELPEKYRRALALVVSEDLTQQQVADRLGISLSGAKSRIQRGRQKLRDMLLQCCHFEFDRYGDILDYQAHCCCCASPSPVA